MNPINNDKLFGLGKVTKKHLLIYIFSPLTYFFANLYSDYFKKLNKEWFTLSLNYFTIYLGYALIGLILISYEKIIDLKENKQTYQKQLCFSKINVSKKLPSFSNKKAVFLFCLIIISDCLATYIDNYFQKYKNFYNYCGYLYPFEIITFVILSYTLLKIQLYKHHLFSIVVIIVGLLIISLINFSKINFYLNESLALFGIFFLQYLYPFIDVIAYYMLYKGEFNFPLFCFLLGIIGIFVGLFVSIFSDIFSLNDLNIFNGILMFKGNTLIKLLLFLLLSIIDGITYSLLYLIFKFFQPCVYSVSAVTNGLLYSIYEILFETFNYYLLIQIFIYLILIFACLVFNEQIICNFWNLNFNTNKDIERRAIFDLNLINEIDKSDEQDTIMDLFN